MKKRLRIYYTSMDTANNTSLPSSKIWHNNLFLSLNKNHEVLQPSFDSTKQFSITGGYVKDKMSPSQAMRYYSSVLYEDIKKKHSEKPIDLFFSYYYNFCVLPETIDKIRQIGIKTVNFYCNSLTHFYLVAEIAPHYDYSMFVEKEAEEKYKAVGANPIYIQEGANPNFYKPYKVKKKYDVTFVGQNYLNRSEYIKYLYTNGVDVRVWGPGWISKYKKTNPKYYLKLLKDRYMGKHKMLRLPKSIVGGLLSDDEFVKMFSRSKISLGFSEILIHDKEERHTIKRHIRLRDFEAPMSGAFYMTGYQEELKKFFKIGKEIVCFDDKKELLEKAEYYLEHDDEREKIRLAGYNRALKDHTWEKRFEELFRKIKLI